ncbi:interferon regulatory factor 9 isoform X2 [Varanus komodoensis]|uniref:interferon regulatory factor 9 isoform X2 n=1 Tax=Varanus komodoensis TaxID=61221 RepID=UPI001CF79D69|nr:interferon regulatory factor 9 isoform X2 [Varanus komodoensis]
MATAKRGMRSTRKLREWTVQQVESGNFPGLVWDDDAKTMFRIPWKHAGKQEFHHEEDAGFFKAWAIFKGKYKPGERLDPATWKTRVRCALSKSPEFEEMKHRSRLDIGEPYKVYRLVPFSEQRVVNQPKQQRRPKLKLEQSSEKTDANATSSSHSPGSLPVLKREESSGSETLASHIPNTFSTLNQNGESSPQPGEIAPDVTKSHLQSQLPEAITATTVGTGDSSVLLSIFYGGKLMLEVQLPEGEFLITSVVAPPGAPTNSMTRVVLPQPVFMEGSEKKETIDRLLKDLERGVMVASNQEGIFIQCRGRANILWWRTDKSQSHSKLEPNTYLKLFNARMFKSEMEQYQQGLVPQPEHQVTLCVTEGVEECEDLDKKFITIQVRLASLGRKDGQAIWCGLESHPETQGQIPQVRDNGDVGMSWAEAQRETNYGLGRFRTNVSKAALAPCPTRHESW